MKRFSSYQASLDFLFNLEKSGIKLGLERTLALLSTVGDPHHGFRSIHLAGTNGKGSVACFLNSILFHAGWSTGLFTSPHLVDYRERIRTDGRVISRRELIDLVTRLALPIAETGASYFEATTVLAFEHFARTGIDVAVVEVGMGGRLDSTNVIMPLVSCITSVDFDHTRYLGKTLSKIAAEKAGIIKRGIPVVCGFLSKAASARIREIARSRKARVFELGKDASIRVLQADLGGSKFEYGGISQRRSLEITAPGIHQVANAATALLVVEVLNQMGLAISDGAVSTGLKRAFWPGRLQILKQKPLVLCDGAHNVSGARWLGRSLRAMGLESEVTVFGVLRDKEYRKMLQHLGSCSRRFVLTKPASDRALPVYKLKEAGKDLGLTCEATGAVADALELALARCSPDGVLLVCGSLYLLGEAMQYFGFKPHLARVC